MIVSIIFMSIAIMGTALWVVYLALMMAQDPDNSFKPLDAAISSMVVLCCAIALAYFAAVDIVEYNTITQSSPPTNNVTSLNGVRLDPDYAGTQVVIYDKIFKVPMDMTPEAQQAYINLIAAREWAIRHPE